MRACVRACADVDVRLDKYYIRGVCISLCIPRCIPLAVLGSSAHRS